MKKIYLALLITLLIIGCATVKANPDEVSLSTAIRQAAALMETRLDRGTKIALVNFTSPSQAFSEYVLDELSSVLVNNSHLTVVDRANLDRIRQELGFNLSGEVSDQSMQSIGQMLGAQALVTGSLTSIADLRRVMFKVLMTETAAVTVQHPADIINDRRVQALLAQGGGSQGLTYSGQGSTTPPPAPPPAATDGGQTPPPAPTPATPTPAFRIGDVGPAGGLIFYDKGNSTGGWRYLEAAPESTEVRRKFLSGSTNPIRHDRINGIDEARTSEELGRGKENTEYLLERILNLGQWDTAVQYCDDLVFGGFDDWFLPSLREVSYMYGNLVRNEIGGFRQEFYWTSTSINRSGGGSITLNQRVVNMRDNTIEYRGGSDVSQQLYVRAARRF